MKMHTMPSILMLRRRNQRHSTIASVFLIFFFIHSDKRVSSPKINRHPVATGSKKLDKSPHLSNSRRTTMPTSTKAQQTIINSHSTSENSRKTSTLMHHHHKSSPPQSAQDGGSSSDDSEHINMDKLKLIKTRAAQRYFLHSKTDIEIQLIYFFLEPWKSNMIDCMDRQHNHWPLTKQLRIQSF